MSKTKEQLLASAEEIRTNTAPNSNTADLVGSTLKDMINKSSDDKDELQNNIDELSEGSSEVISSVRSDLSSEVARAKAAENAAAAAVTAEETRAKAAESALNTSLTGVKSDMNTLSLVNDGVKYAGLIGIDDDTNKYAANAVPTDKRKVGLIVTYLDKNGNPQTYQFTGSNISQWLTITTWQGIDDVPTAGSNNLVKSGGVHKGISKLFSDFNFITPEYSILGSLANRRTVSSTANVGDTYDFTLTTVNGAYYNVYKIPVSEGMKYKIGVVAEKEYAKVWAFIDENNIVLSCADLSSGTVLLESSIITAPQNSKWLVIHTYHSVQVNENASDFVGIYGTLEEHEDSEHEKDIEDNYTNLTELFVPVILNSLITDDGIKSISNSVAIYGCSVSSGDIIVIKNILAKTKKSNYTWSSVFYAFYKDNYNDESLIINGPISGYALDVTIEVPENANLLAISSTSSNPRFSIFKKINLNKITKAVEENKEDIDTINSKVQKIINRAIADYPLGVADNYFQYITKNIFIHNLVNNSKLSYGYTIKDNNDKYTRIYLSQNSLGSGVKYADIVLCVKKQTGKWLVVYSTQGAFCSYKFEDFTAGMVINSRRGNGTLDLSTVWGKVLYVDTEYVQIHLSIPNSYTHVVRVLDYYRYREGTDTELPFEINEDYCGLFYSELVPSDGIKPMVYYKSRAEKLNSNLTGKTAICFGDSLSKYMQYLVNDWGLQVYMIGEGGNRMAYLNNDNNHWLCRSSIIANFKANKPTSVDYVINMDGTNELELPAIDSEELQFVYNNKNWFDKTLDTEPFDSLSANDKLRFNGTACYIIAFYSLSQLYPTAQAVVVEPFFNRAYSTNFVDGKWKDIESFADNLYANQDGLDAKKSALRDIAKLLDAIYVEDYTRVGFINAPSCITDGTHPNNMGTMSKAWSIAKAINFPADVDNSYV